MTLENMLSEVVSKIFAENIFDLCNQITTHYPASVRIFFPLLHQPKYKEV